MDLKVGAGGDLTVTVGQNGDIVLAFKDTEKLSDQQVSVALHPQVLGAALVSVLGGASWVQSLVNFLIAELIALTPKG